MSYQDRIELERLLGSFIYAPKNHLTDDEKRTLRKAMRLIGRENHRYADLYL